MCSPTNVVLYLFKLMKYIHKGGDVNRLQLVADGKEAHGRQGSADGSTHRRDERRDEIRDWRNAKTTCAPQAYRRIAGHTTYANVASYVVKGQAWPKASDRATTFSI